MDDESLVVLEYKCSDGALILATVEAGYHAPGKMREVVIVGKDSSAVCDYNVAQYKIRTFDNRHLSDGSKKNALERTVRQLEVPPQETLPAQCRALLDAI